MGTWIIIVALGCGLVAAIREALTARALTAEVREERDKATAALAELQQRADEQGSWRLLHGDLLKRHKAKVAELNSLLDDAWDLVIEGAERLKVTLAVYRSVEDEKSRISSALEKALNAVDQPRHAVDDKIALLDTSHAREEVERGKFVASKRLKELLEKGYEVHIVSTRQEFLPETADKCLFDLLPERNFWCCDQGLEGGGLNSPAQVDVWLRAIGGIDYDGYDGCNIVDLRVDLRLRPDGWHRKGQVEIQEEARRHGIVVNHR